MKIGDYKVSEFRMSIEVVLGNFFIVYIGVYVYVNGYKIW